MNFEEALKKLDEGKKVKLPEWQGHWFQKGNQIFVEARTGDILDTPFMEDYKNRTDWEETNGLRDFGGALTAVKHGKKIARQGWNGKGMFAFMVNGSKFQVSRAPLNEIYPEGTEVEYRPHIDLKAADGTIGVWNPNMMDILAEDWQIVE